MIGVGSTRRLLFVRPRRCRGRRLVLSLLHLFGAALRRPFPLKFALRSPSVCLCVSAARRAVRFFTLKAWLVLAGFVVPGSTNFLMSGANMVLPALVSAGSSLIGGLFGKKSAKRDQERQYEEARRQEDLQRQFAQNSIQWRVADAKKAGIHPLYALGAAGASYTPVSGSVAPPDPLGASIAAAGQDIARGIDATRTQGQKVDAYTKTVQDLTVTRMGLENTLLASQIAKVNQAGMPPPMAGVADRFMLDGQSNTPSSGLVQNEAMLRTVPNPGNATQEPGAVVDVGYVRTPTGYMPVMSEDAKRRLEEDFVGTMLWNIRNRLLPTFSQSAGNPPVPGYVYHPTHQEYRKPRPRYTGGGW